MHLSQVQSNPVYKKMSDINNLRNKMDAVTLEMINLLKTRTDIAKEIGEIKKNIGKRVGERQHEKLLLREEAEQALERDEMFIIRPNVDYEIFHSFAKESYPGTSPAEVREYSSKDETPISKKKIQEMLLSNWTLE